MKTFSKILEPTGEVCIKFTDEELEALKIKQGDKFSCILHNSIFNSNIISFTLIYVANECFKLVIGIFLLTIIVGCLILKRDMDVDFI